MSAGWKRDVVAKLTAKGWTRQRLEEELGAGRGMVTRMLSPTQQTSALVDDVNRLLGIVEDDNALTAEERTALEAFRRLTGEQRRNVIGIMHGLAKR